MNKFRVWDKETNTMYYPGEDGTQMIFGVTHVYGEEGHHTWQLWDEEGEVVREGKAELMQWTGLKDEDGFEIYEGDIVEYGLHAGLVTFKESGFKFEFSDGESDFIGELDETGMEIIGNIYEEPELLEVLQ